MHAAVKTIKATHVAVVYYQEQQHNTPSFSLDAQTTPSASCYFQQCAQIVRSRDGFFCTKTVDRQGRRPFRNRFRAHAASPARSRCPAIILRERERELCVLRCVGSVAFLSFLLLLIILRDPAPCSGGVCLSLVYCYRQDNGRLNGAINGCERPCNNSGRPEQIGLRNRLMGGTLP